MRKQIRKMEETENRKLQGAMRSEKIQSVQTGRVTLDGDEEE